MGQCFKMIIRFKMIMREIVLVIKNKSNFSNINLTAVTLGSWLKGVFL